MKKLSLAILFLGLGVFVVGCGGSDAPNEGAVNSGAGDAGDPMEDPASDAGVGTDPSLMDPN